MFGRPAWFVVAVVAIVSLSMTVEACWRCAPCASIPICDPNRPSVSIETQRQTIERIAARLAALESFVRARSDVPEPVKSEILAQLEQIGTPALVITDPNEPPVDPARGIPALSRESVNSVRNELRAIQRALNQFKAAMGLRSS